MSRILVAAAMFAGGIVATHTTHDFPVATPSAVTPGKQPRHAPSRVSRWLHREPVVGRERASRDTPTAHGRQRHTTPTHNWQAVSMCESSGDWQSSVGMFEGGLQFLPSTWLAYGGAEFAVHAYDATREQQITVAERVLAGQGAGAWPVCGYHLGDAA